MYKSLHLMGVTQGILHKHLPTAGVSQWKPNFSTIPIFIVGLHQRLGTDQARNRKINIDFICVIDCEHRAFEI
jgi:hypothetical protein